MISSAFSATDEDAKQLAGAVWVNDLIGTI
jgi:hypothetical protein